MFKDHPALLKLKSELSQKDSTKNHQKTKNSSQAFSSHSTKQNQTKNSFDKKTKPSYQNSNSRTLNKDNKSTSYFTSTVKGSRVCKCGCKEEDFLTDSYSNDDLVINNGINSAEYIKNDTEEYVCPCCIQSQIVKQETCCTLEAHNQEHLHHQHKSSQLNHSSKDSKKFTNHENTSRKPKTDYYNLQKQQLEKLNYNNFSDNPQEIEQLKICDCHNVNQIKEQTAQFCTGKNCTCVHDDHRINHEQIVGILRINPKGFGFVEAANKSYYVNPHYCSKCINNCEVAFVKYKNREGYAANIKSILPKLMTNITVYVSSVSPLRITIEGDTTKKTYPARLAIKNNLNLESSTGTDQVVDINKIKLNDCFLASPIDVNVVLNDTQAEIEFDLIQYLGNDSNVYLEWYKSLAKHSLPFKTESTNTIAQNLDQGTRVDLTGIPFVSIDAKDTIDIDDIVYCYELTGTETVKSTESITENTLKPGFFALNISSNSNDNINSNTKPKNLEVQHLEFALNTGLNEANLSIPTHTKYILAVGIADPSHYIELDSAIDQQAKLFTQTYYLPALTINMLPEFVVNDYCSLIPNHNKPAIVNFMYFDDKASFITMETRIATVSNKCKLDYDNVTTYLETNQLPNPDFANNSEFLNQINILNKFYNARVEWRQQHGRLINNSNSNINYSIDKDGKCIGIEVTEFSIAHKIISECMLCTNTFIAQFSQAHNLNVIYTAQDGIKDNNYTHFLDYLNYLSTEKAYTGINAIIDLDYLIKNLEIQPGCLCASSETKAIDLKTSNSEELENDNLDDNLDSNISAEQVTTKALTLEDFRKVRSYIEDKSSNYNNRLNRFMQSARYCHLPQSHQGLGETCYLTCTSPIRKYVDLFNQRNIKRFIWEQEQIPFDLALIDHLNTVRSELRSSHRDIAKDLHYQYLRSRVNEDLVVEVSSIINAGIRVKLVDCGVLGFIYMAQLNPDQQEVKVNINNITVKIGNECLEFGDRFKATLKRVDKDKFILNPVLVDNKIVMV